jgi:inner membrane protein
MVCGVDWITQAALGALIGELMMAKRLGKVALAWGALFGLLPGLEVAIFPFLDTAGELACERGLGHSLVLMPLVSWGLAKGLVKIWKRQKIPVRQAWAFLAVVWGAHLILDGLGVEGVAMGWPFSIKRVSFAILPEVDFLFSAPLVVAVLWLAFLKEVKPKKSKSKKPFSKRTKVACWGIGVAGVYTLLAVAVKSLASAAFDADLARRDTRFFRRMDSPTAFNILLWRSLVDRGDEIWVGYHSVFEGRRNPVRWTIYPKGESALSKVADLRESKTLTALTNGWWIARPNVKGAWLGDMRFCETRILGNKKDTVDSRLAVSWLIDEKKDGNRLRQILPGQKEPDALNRLMKRIGGDRGAWEANPRLAGALGSLPEFLAVEE